MPKRKSIVAKIGEDNIEDVGKNDLLQTTLAILNNLRDVTSLEEATEITPDVRSDAKMVLGYINAANSVMKTKMNFFKTASALDRAADAIRDKSKTL